MNFDAQQFQTKKLVLLQIDFLHTLAEVQMIVELMRVVQRESVVIMDGVHEKLKKQNFGLFFIKSVEGPRVKKKAFQQRNINSNSTFK